MMFNQPFFFKKRTGWQFSQKGGGENEWLNLGVVEGQNSNYD